MKINGITKSVLESPRDSDDLMQKSVHNNKGKSILWYIYPRELMVNF